MISTRSVAVIVCYLASWSNAQGVRSQGHSACSSSPCHGSATCEIDPVTQDARCICPAGWVGSDCSVDIDECEVDPCTSGQCVNCDGSFFCECFPGYTGVLCDHDIDVCRSNPCLNGGTCLNNVQHFECICIKGYTGEMCECDIDECESNPCRNDATCVDNVNGYTCTCQNGWIGHNCDESDNIEEVLAEVKAMMQAVECAGPRPTLIDAYDAMDIEKSRIIYVQPACVEVDRCGPQSGCCPWYQICSVKEGSIRNVTRQLLIASVSSESRMQRRVSIASYPLKIEEHTECECRDRQGCDNLECRSPKMKDPAQCICVCQRRCPMPYISDGDTCGCTCRMESTVRGRACRNIYRGKETMTEGECECVRSQQCSPPACRHRYIFDNTTCTCTRKPATTSDPFDESYTDPLSQIKMEVGAMHGASPSATPFGDTEDGEDD